MYDPAHPQFGTYNKYQCTTIACHMKIMIVLKKMHAIKTTPIHMHYFHSEVLLTVHEQGYTCTSQSLQQFDACNEQATQLIKTMAILGEFTRITSKIGREI